MCESQFFLSGESVQMIAIHTPILQWPQKKKRIELNKNSDLQAVLKIE